jgi:hypothetical protein
MFGFNPLGNQPFSAVPTITVVALRSVPIEIRAGEVIALNNLPVEIIGEKTVAKPLKWVLSGRGNSWEINAQNLKWDIK